MPEVSTNIAETILSGGRADDPAIFCGPEVVTYAELRAAAYGWAQRFLDEGLAPGDRVGLFAENGPLFVAAYLGVIRAGGCVVPFQVDCSEKTFLRIAASVAARRIIVSPRFLARVLPWAEQLGIPLLTETDDRCPAVPFPPLPVIAHRRHLAAIMLTSGSTGEAKGVMVTHRNLECNTRDIIEYLELGPHDRVMVVLPFYYCYGASLLHTHLAAGGSVVLNNRFLFPEKVLDELEEKRCTGLAGVPSTYQILLRRSRFARRTFPALRWLQQAGGKLPDPFLRELHQAMPQVKLFVMYGQTEGTARLSYLPPERLADKMGSIGRGLASTRLEVLRPDGTPVRPGSDEVGEIVASGENIALGYWDDPEETCRYFRDDRLFTGDMARVDEDGFIFIVERSRDFIKAMGNRVSPKEVEDVIAELPQVVEVAVIGVPDDLCGEAVKAFVVTVLPGQLTADDVKNQCLGRLPNYKVPAAVEFLRSLPKTANGKVAKEKLKAGRDDLR